MTPDEAVELEIKAKHKDGKQKLSFELEWKEDLQTREPALKVSSKEEKRAETGSAHQRIGTKIYEEQMTMDPML